MVYTTSSSLSDFDDEKQTAPDLVLLSFSSAEINNLFGVLSVCLIAVSS